LRRRQRQGARWQATLVWLWPGRLPITSRSTRTPNVVPRPCRAVHWSPVTSNVKSHMALVTARIYYQARTQRRTLKLSRTHWGFAEWFLSRLKPIREELRGQEAKGVDIVNLMLHEVPDHAPYPNEWRKLANTFNFSFVCDLSPLEASPPIENIEKLMVFMASVASGAPWPQVRAVGRALAVPLTPAERQSLLPFLKWPRQSIYIRR
jgi:hypothetical protein